MSIHLSLPLVETIFVDVEEGFACCDCKDTLFFDSFSSLLTLSLTGDR